MCHLFVEKVCSCGANISTDVKHDRPSEIERCDNTVEMFSKLSLESKQTNDALSGSQVQRVSDESVNYFERNSGIDSNEADEMVKSDARCIDDVQTNSDRSMLTDAAQSTADETTQELTCESQELDCLIAEGLSNDDIVGKLTCEIFLRLLAY